MAQPRDVEPTPRVLDERTRIAQAFGWRPAEERPSQEGAYLGAMRATHTRAPRIDLVYFTRELGWSSRYMTHWQPLPANPNVIGEVEA